jgi:hypothetical protein
VTEPNKTTGVLMLGRAQKTAVVVAVAGALAVSSFAYGAFTTKASLAATTIDRTVHIAAEQAAVARSTAPRSVASASDGLVVQSTGGTQTTSYLKFTVTRAQVGSDRLVGAKLLLTPQAPLPVPVDVHAVRTNSWTPTTLTFSNAPELGTVIGTASAGSGTTRWVDVSSWVTQPGTYSFGLTVADGTARFSVGGARPGPELITRLQGAASTTSPGSGGGKPTPTNSPTATQSPKPAPTTSASPRGCKARFPGDPCAGTMYYGASMESGEPRDLESQIGRTLPLFRSYMQPSTPAAQFTKRASADAAAGRIPLISTKTPGSWASVAAGKQDAWLTERVKALATVKGPVWLALHHEPTGDGAPADWVAMQQHARKVIDKHSTNIALVGILNGWDFVTRGGNPQAFRMPLGTGVDIMGFDSYNFWTPSNGMAWRSVEQIMAPGLAIQKWGYPTLVGETGIHADPAHPGRAATWMRDQYEYGVTHGFLAISYFNSTANSKDGGWTLTGERLAAFNQNLSRSTTARLQL